jgi:hypothetical protein
LGVAPQPFPVVEIVSSLHVATAHELLFRNPFNQPVLVHTSLKISASVVTSGQPAPLVLSKPGGLHVIPLAAHETLSLPLIFSPSRPGLLAGVVAVETLVSDTIEMSFDRSLPARDSVGPSGLVFAFPIQAVSEISAPHASLLIETTAGTVWKNTLYLPLADVEGCPSAVYSAFVDGVRGGLLSCSASQAVGCF